MRSKRRLNLFSAPLPKTLLLSYSCLRIGLQLHSPEQAAPNKPIRNDRVDHKPPLYCETSYGVINIPQIFSISAEWGEMDGCGAEPSCEGSGARLNLPEIY